MTELDGLFLIASAIAGKDVEVAALDREGPAWTDGSTISLDATMPRIAQIESLSVQASLLAQGSLERDVVNELARRPALARRYLAIEGHRALAANASVLPPRVLAVVDHELASRVESPADSLRLARSNRDIADPPPCFGTIRPRRVRSVSGDDEPGAIAAAPGTQLAQPASVALRELPDDDDEGEDLGSLLASPVGGGGPIGRLLSKLLSPSRKRGGGGPAGADAPTHVGGARARGGAVVAANTPASGLENALVGQSGLTYPEWDVNRRRYRPDWCTVIERDAPLQPGAATTIPDVTALRRALARLGLGLVPARRRRQGEDLDIDAVVEARVQTLAGVPSDDALYVESVRQRRDLAVLVLLDVSGSAAEPGADGRRIHDHQQLLALQLTAAVHDLGDRVALYAFNSRGRSAVQLFRVKGFDDGLDANVLRRVHSLTPGAYTRLGAAIRHGTVLAEQAGTPRRLLVVVSDGFAYDHGYEGRYGEADARRALLEARRRGVGCLCLSVATDTDPSALRRVFGSAAYARLPSVPAFARVAAPLFRAALRSADAHRRTFQRKERSRELLEIARSGTA